MNKISKEYIMHILVTVDSDKELNEAITNKAAKAAEQSIYKDIVIDEIGEDVTCECTLWEEV